MELEDEFPMMATTTASRKFKDMRRIHLSVQIQRLFTLLFCFYSWPTFAEVVQMPILYNVGIIPASVDTHESSTFEIADKIKLVIHNFSSAIKGSHRFNMIDDDLVSGFWSSSENREKLTSEYEISAFFHLTLVTGEDSLRFIARLLSPDLSPYLQEMETITNDQIKQWSPLELESFVKNLVFRVINRLPIDVTINSIQGRYATLSGGSNQGLKVGDHLEFIRPFVREKNPADKTWKSFDSKVAGKGKIIEVKNLTSIALITDSSPDSYIKIGDGIKIEILSSREYFVKYGVPAPSSSDSILYASKPEHSSPAQESAKTLTPDPIPAPQSPQTETQSTTSSSAPSDIKSKLSSLMEFKPPEFGQYVERLVDTYTLIFKQNFWNYSGPSSTGSKFAWYLPVNSIGARVESQLFYKLNYDGTAEVSFGKTSHAGGYYTGSAQLRFFWVEGLTILPERISHLRAGVHGQVSTRHVEKEQYGGYDLFQAGLFAGLLGSIHSSKDQQYHWSTDFSITPLVIGRIGYQGGRRVSQSAFGFGFDSEVYKAPKEATDFRFGGGFGYKRDAIHDSSDNLLTLSNYYLQLLVRKSY